MENLNPRPNKTSQLVLILLVENATNVGNHESITRTNLSGTAGVVSVLFEELRQCSPGGTTTISGTGAEVVDEVVRQRLVRVAATCQNDHNVQIQKDKANELLGAHTVA